MEAPKFEDAFWRFVAERQSIYARRARGDAAPWTTDSILQGHRFTNVYRAADRVSQYAIREVLYTGSQDRTECAFRAVLFRMFNLPETWNMLRLRLGEQPSLENWDANNYIRLMDAHVRSGGKLWTGAYMVTPPVFSYGSPKHYGWLLILDSMVRRGVFAWIGQAARSMDVVYEMLRSYPTVGDFFAFQWTIDINYSVATDFDENDFVIAGPGALRGLSKLYGKSFNQAMAQEAIRDLCGSQVLYLGERYPFHWLGGSRKLHLIDVQNCLCEWDKYTREAMPELGRTGRLYSRIKQSYDQRTAQSNPPIAYMWPPKWGLGDVA